MQTVYIDGVKSQVIPFEKKIVDINDAVTNVSTVDYDSGIVGAGDTVTYMISGYIPYYNPGLAGNEIKTFEITDTPDAGIDVTLSTVHVYVSDDNDLTTTADNADVTTGLSEKITAYTASGKGAGFKLSIDGATLRPASGTNLEGKYIFVQFDAVMNSALVEGTAGNKNTASLSFGNEFVTGQGDGTADDDTTVYTTQIVLNKTGKASQAATIATALPGAKFQLYKDSVADANKVGSVATTDSQGQIRWTDLAPGTYILHETEPPEGFQLIPSDITVVISATDTSGTAGKTLYDGTSYTADTGTSASVGYTADVDYKNGTNDTADDIHTAGFSDTVEDVRIVNLPGTGGSGIVVFALGGAFLVLLAGAAAVVYTRRKKNEE